MISMVLDRERPLDVVQTILSQRIRFEIWTENEVGMRYEHLNRERLMHSDRIEIVANPATILRLLIREVLLVMGLESSPYRTLLLDSASARGICSREGVKNHASFVNESSMVFAVGEMRCCHGRSV